MATSEQATLWRVPVVFLGVAYFVAMVVVCWPSAWRSSLPALLRGRVILAATGAAFEIYLNYVELFLVDAICLWCTAVHIVALAPFGLVALATAAMPAIARR